MQHIQIIWILKVESGEDLTSFFLPNLSRLMQEHEDAQFIPDTLE